MGLTEIQIRKAKATSRMYKLSDGNGLFLQVRKSGSKVFVVEYRFEGKRRTHTVGEFPGVRLSSARAEASVLVAKAKAGEDPRPAEKASHPTGDGRRSHTFIPVERRFETLSDRFIEKRIAEGVADATIDKLRWNLGFASDWFRGRDIASIEPPEVLAIVEFVQAQGKLEKAKDVHRKIGQVFDFAVGLGFVRWNPAQMVKRAVVRTKGGKHPGITDPKKVGELMRAISGYSGHVPVRAALVLSALCVLRSKELRLAQRKEIDFESRQWVIPKERMKGHYGEHIVPLSTQAVEVLSGLMTWLGIEEQPEAFLFPSMTHADRAISGNTLNSALRRLGYDTRKEHCQHGFRTTFSTNLNEQGWNKDWVERQLCHVDRDEVRSSYNKALYLEGRTEMMQRYSDWLYGMSSK